ncbi:MAG: hypothetical protein AB1705_15855 [Verrucomicrobiota bacterium]
MKPIQGYHLIKRVKTKPDLSLIYPVDPKQLPKELTGVEWPPKGGGRVVVQFRVPLPAEGESLRHALSLLFIRRGDEQAIRQFAVGRYPARGQ